MTRGVEDHVKFAPIPLNNALEVVYRKDELASFREEGTDEVFVKSDVIVSIYAIEKS